MDISLFLLLVKAVKLLAIAHGAECGNRENLSLTSCEQTRAVRSCKEVDFGVERTNFVYASAVDSLVLVLEPGANNVLLNKIHNLLDLALIALESLIKFLVNSLVYRQKSLVADKLVVCIKSLFDILYAEVLNLLHNVGIGVGGFVSELRLADFVYNALNELYDFFVFLVTCHNAVEHKVIGNFVAACLNHGNKVCR